MEKRMILCHDAIMNPIKKHIDTVIIMGGILGCFLWMNSRLTEIEMRLVRIETVLVIKGILPEVLAVNSDE
jgi:hypothetical protein